MGIVVLIISGYLFNRRIRDEDSRNRMMIWGAVLLYFAFSLFLNWYLREKCGWAHGIPGSDLQRYYNGAYALVHGTRITDLVSIDAAYEVSITHIGYLAFVIFIAVTALSPVIFTLEISLQILYCVQAFAAITACINIADFFCDYEDKRLRNRVLWAMLLCTSVLQCAVILMRDIWILFFISCMLRECKKDNSIVRCIVYTFISFAFRYYTLAITIPILIGYKFNKKKIAAIVSLCVFAVFFVGQNYINIIAHIVGIRWIYEYKFDLYSIASFILFPSPLNQAYNVQHMNPGFHSSFGGNTEWVYYMLSCWNVYVFPISAYGIFRSIKDKEVEDAALWGMIIINIAMLMCLFYRATSSPRHKLLIVISLVYFFKKGIQNMTAFMKAFYLFAATIILILIFAIA